jgi:hypothetical protein
MAVAMLVVTGGCATLGAHGGRATRSARGIQDSEIRELAEHFAQTVDCRRGTADPHAFMCPIAALRVKPFVPPAPARALLGVSLEISTKAGLINIERSGELRALYAGPRFQAVATVSESDAAGEEWDQTVVDALFERLAGRARPFVLQPELQPMLAMRVPEVAPLVDWGSLPERYFRVSTQNGLEVIVEVTPLAGPNMRITLFPVIDALAESSKDPRDLAVRQAAFDARRRASDSDDAKPPLGMKQVGHLRDAVRRARVCSRKVRSTLAMQELCALSTVGLNGAPLPEHDQVYVGLLFEVIPGAVKWPVRRVSTALLSLLEAGPDRIRPASLGPDDEAEAKAIAAAADGLAAHLTGHAAGPMTTTPQVLRDVASLAASAPPPGAPVEHPSARLYEGQVPGGDEVYVVLMPRKGGGMLIGIYPKVPWSAGSAPMQSARR